MPHSVLGLDSSAFDQACQRTQKDSQLVKITVITGQGLCTERGKHAPLAWQGQQTFADELEHGALLTDGRAQALCGNCKVLCRPLLPATHMGRIL